jgi:hypothetical protein
VQVTGVSLDSLVTIASPVLPAVKNALLRVIVTASGPFGHQVSTETGPVLAEVLRAAHVRTDLNTWVAAVGSDGYVATVTPAEAWPGGRPLLTSLIEDGVPLSAPRLVTDGDIKGGRYVSGVYDLVVGQGAPASLPARMTGAHRDIPG